VNGWRSIADFLALKRNTALLLVALSGGTGEKLWLGFAPNTSRPWGKHPRDRPVRRLQTFLAPSMPTLRLADDRWASALADALQRLSLAATPW